MFVFKTLIRDKLVDNANIKTLFNAAATGSCAVRMAELQVSAVYPQVTIDYVGGATIGGMAGEEGRLYLRIETKGGTGSEHGIKNLGQFRRNILSILDDTNHSATAVVYHCRKTNESGDRFDDINKCYYNTLGFDIWLKVNTTVP